MSTSSQKHKYQAYATATQTVAKTQQILMLYDGVIRMIQQAKEAINEKRIEDRYNLLIKASNIIHGLQGCLDFDNGKEIANILYSFYSTIDSKLFSIHRTNSPEACDEVIDDLKKMRDAWQVVDEEALKASAPMPPVGEAEQPMQENESRPVSPVSVTLSA